MNTMISTARWLSGWVLFPPPASTFVRAMSVISLVSLASTGLRETMGLHLGYSKMFHVKTSNPKSQQRQRQIISVPSRVGMLILYVPSLLCGAASLLFLYPVPFLQRVDIRFLLLRLALTAHFLKRVLEVLFLHNYSGSMDIMAITMIPISYTLGTVTMIHAQHLSLQLPAPSIDLMYPGIFLFLLGMSGNFYHHYILSSLRSGRKDGDHKGYKIPKGGMFNLVVCPHYLFEIIDFLGITCIAQTYSSLSFTMGSSLYLIGRSYATRKWYVSKFDNFPNHIKALIPYLY